MLIGSEAQRLGGSEVQMLQGSEVQRLGCSEVQRLGGSGSQDGLRMVLRMGVAYEDPYEEFLEPF